MIASAIALALAGLHLGFRAPRVVGQGTPPGLGHTLSEARITTRHGKRLFAWFIPSAAAGVTVVRVPVLFMLNLALSPESQRLMRVPSGHWS